jgi:uncharacterized membrane protein
MLHWLVIIILAVVVYRQGEALKRLEALLGKALGSRDALPDAVRPAAPPVTRPAAAPAPAASVAELRPSARVSTPVTPPSAPPPRVTEFARRPVPPQRRPEPRPAPPPSKPMEWTSVSTWLAENGLAWIGGGGLALGGLLLVVYAAQQGVFTPPLRIAAAVGLGGLMIAASEWILRQKQAPGGRHLLAAAVAAGAGAVTLYGAVCAAHSLYGLIPFPVAAMLAGAVSLGLLGLALRHGEPLALLALFGAVITPWVTGISVWSPTALLAWALLIGVTGFVISAARLWGKAGFMTLGGLLVWSLSGAFGGGAALLLLLAAAGPACTAFWRRANRQDDPADPQAKLFFRQPAAALVFASLLSVQLWTGDPGGVAHLPAAVLVSGALVALGAAIVALGLAPAGVFAAPVAVAVFATLATLALDGRHPAFGACQPWIHGLTALIPVAALAAALGSPPAARTTLLGVGGVGVAVLANLAWPLLDAAGMQLAWLPAAILSGALFATAVLIVRRVEDVLRDRGLVLWLAAAAELAFLSIHAAVLPQFEPLAFAAAALVLALASGRLSWAGLAQAGVAAGLFTLATMFRPDFIGAALAGRLSLAFTLAVSVGSAALLWLAARMTPNPRAPNRNEIEAQTTAALMVLLTGLFIGLHVILTGAQPDAASGGLFEASLRTLLVLAAGVLLVSRQRADDGPIARWRTGIVVCAGAIHGLFVQGLLWNPWWGLGAPPVGLPVLNTLIVAFLAPAALLAVCAARRRPMDRWARLWAATGALFAFVWALLAVRHLFQGADMGVAGIGRAEGCAYAVLLLATVRAFAQDRFNHPLAVWLGRAAPPIGWAALVFAGLTFGLLASPWWGLSQAPLAIADGALVFGLYAVGAVLAWAVSRKSIALGRAALAVAFGIALVLVLHLIRWAFQGPAMAVGQIGPAEAAAYAVVGLAAARLLLTDRIMAASARTEWLRRASPALTWAAMALAALVFGLYASPWWGPMTAPLASVPAAVLLFGLYALGAAAMASLQPARGPMGRAATAGTVGILFALMTLLIRWVFHGGAMSVPTPGGGLETWTFSALWAVFGLAVLSLGAARRDVALRWAGLAVLLFTAAKVMLFDLARLEGVIRAASFLAVGALFLAGAIAARRLNTRASAREDADTP